MRKGDIVVELTDPTHVGVYTGRRFKGRLLVRWHKRCARWLRRSDLRLATLRDGLLPVVPSTYSPTNSGEFRDGGQL